MEEGMNSLNMEVRLKNLLDEGQQLVHQEKFTEGERCLDKAFLLASSANLEGGQGYALHFLGQVYMGQGHYNKAYSAHLTAMDIFKKWNLKKEKWSACNGCGIALIKLNRYREGLACLEGIDSKDCEDPQVKSVLASHMGIAHYKLGEFDLAINQHMKAIEWAKGVNDPVEQRGILYAKSLGNLANVYEEIGRYEEASDCYIEAYTKAKGHKETLAILCGSLITTLTRAKKSEEATRYFNEAVELAKSNNDVDSLGRAYGNFSNLQQALGNWEEAKQASLYDLELTKGRDKLGEASAHGILGNICREMGDYDEAVEHHKRHKQLSSEIPNWVSYAKACQNYGVTLGRQGNLECAKKEIGEAVETCIKLQNQLEEEASKITLFEEQSKSYRLLVDILIELKEPIVALAQADFGKSRVLSDQLRSTSVTEQIQGPMSIEEIQQLVESNNRMFIFYSSNTLYPERLNCWVVLPKGSDRIRFTPINIGDLPLQEVSINMSDQRGEREGSVGGGIVRFVAPPKFDEGLRLSKKGGKGKQLGNRQADSFYQSNKIYLQKLYNTLITPIEGFFLPDTPLSFILDTPLQKIPFAILLDKDEKYLIEKRIVSTVPSFESLKWLSNRGQNRQQGSGMVVVTNPTQDLPYAQDESNAIKEAVEKPQVLKESAATVKNVEENVSQAKYLHLICHGNPDALSHPHSIFKGALRLAENQDWGSEAISRLKLMADLVFLSACQTGAGRELQEGTIGLVRSFLTAGANSVIATHWSIPDADTVLVVKAFYQELKQGKDKGEALQSAMLEAIHEKEWRYSPERWGAFFLTGLPVLTSEQPK